MAKNILSSLNPSWARLRQSANRDHPRNMCSSLADIPVMDCLLRSCRSRSAHKQGRHANKARRLARLTFIKGVDIEGTGQGTRQPLIPFAHASSQGLLLRWPNM